MAAVISKDHVNGAQPILTSNAGTQPEPANGVRTKESLAQHDAEHGATTRTFNPDATPEEKAAAAMKDKPAAAAVPHIGPGGSEVTLGGGKKVAATTSASDAARISAEEKTKNETGSATPNTVVTTNSNAKVGWSGATIDDPSQEKWNFLQQYLDESMYGTPFHNAGIIVFAVGFTHIVDVFIGGWIPCLVVIAFCAQYYSLSIKRVRRRARDDITRELSKQRLFTDHETVDWINVRGKALSATDACRTS